MNFAANCVEYTTGVPGHAATGARASADQWLAPYFEARVEQSGFVAATYHAQKAGDYEQVLRCTKRAAEIGDMFEEGSAKRTMPFGEWCSSLIVTLEQLSLAGRPRRELYRCLYVGTMAIISFVGAGFAVALRALRGRNLVARRPYTRTGRRRCTGLSAPRLVVLAKALNGVVVVVVVLVEAGRQHT